MVANGVGAVAVVVMVWCEGGGLGGGLAVWMKYTSRSLSGASLVTVESRFSFSKPVLI